MFYGFRVYSKEKLFAILKSGPPGFFFSNFFIVYCKLIVLFIPTYTALLTLWRNNLIIYSFSKSLFFRCTREFVRWNCVTTALG